MLQLIGYERHRLWMQVYGVIGIFGAARYGDRTQGNILVNRWLGGPAEGVLDLAIAAYLSISVPPMQVDVLATLITQAKLSTVMIIVLRLHRI